MYNYIREKAHLQSQLLEIRKTFEQRLDEERNRHERLEKELRDEITYQVSVLPCCFEFALATCPT